MGHIRVEFGVVLGLSEILARQRGQPIEITLLDVLGALYVGFAEKISRYFERPELFESLVVRECKIEYPRSFYLSQHESGRSSRNTVYIPGTTRFITLLEPDTVVRRSEGAEDLIHKVWKRARLEPKATASVE